MLKSSRKPTLDKLVDCEGVSPILHASSFCLKVYSFSLPSATDFATSPAPASSMDRVAVLIALAIGLALACAPWGRAYNFPLLVPSTHVMAFKHVYSSFWTAGR